MSATPIDDGGPAFPAPDLGEQDFGQRGAYPGMTLRDHFAGLAMQALVMQRCYPTDDQVAKWAYHVADLMLRERAK